MNVTAKLARRTTRLPRTVGLANRSRAKALPLAPEESAKLAACRYVDDAGPGIRRVRSGKGFEYVSPDGTTIRDLCSVESKDVNDYIKRVAGDDFTAKDFRTWAGTVLTALTLRELVTAGESAPTKKSVVQAVTSVSARLGSTPSVCRKCYVPPEVFEAYAEGQLATSLATPRAERAEAAERAETAREAVAALSNEEAAVLVLLQARLVGRGARTASNAA